MDKAHVLGSASMTNPSLVAPRSAPYSTLFIKLQGLAGNYPVAKSLQWLGARRLINADVTASGCVVSAARGLQGLLQGLPHFPGSMDSQALTSALRGMNQILVLEVTGTSDWLERGGQLGRPFLSHRTTMQPPSSSVAGLSEQC